MQKKDKEEFLLLAEGGFIAVNQADEDAAVKLFRAAELIDPENILPKIGFGYLHLHKLELKQAIDKFDAALVLEPGNEMATAFRGLCYSLMPKSIDKGEKMLEETLHKSHDPLIKKMAGAAIDFVEKFVKKPKGPHK